MTVRQFVSRSCVVGCMVAAGAVAASAQGPDGSGDRDIARRRELERLANKLAQARAAVRPVPSSQTSTIAGGDPMAGPVVRNAPYSGDAVTTITQVLSDGTRIEQGTTAKFYRDNAGRVRREQTIIGLAALNPSGVAQTVVTIDPDPGDAFAYQLDSTARTAHRVSRGSANILATFGVADGIAPGVERRASGFPIDGRAQAIGDGTASVRSRASPVQAGSRPVVRSLGTRQMEGVKATGRKTTVTIPTGQIGNDRPIEITDERWDSPELQVLLYSRHSDPRTGIVEYRLTNVSRVEPPPDLFMVPPGYTIDEGARGTRSGGAGGRGAPATAGRGRQ